MTIGFPDLGQGTRAYFWLSKQFFSLFLNPDWAGAGTENPISRKNMMHILRSLFTKDLLMQTD